MTIKASKHWSLCGMALAVVFSSGATRAAENAPSGYVLPAPAFSWTGIHAGVNAGEAFGSHDSFDSFRLASDNGRNNLTAGGQLGYDYQLK